MSEHTPGPWTRTGSGIGSRVWGSNGELVSMTNNANASLIAAAPAMLEALRMLTTQLRFARDCFEDGEDLQGILFGDVTAEALEMADSVLTKATTA